MWAKRNFRTWARMVLAYLLLKEYIGHTTAEVVGMLFVIQRTLRQFSMLLAGADDFDEPDPLEGDGGEAEATT